MRQDIRLALPTPDSLKLGNQRIAFRADASLEIGSGHVMRCLTLADALRDKGAECWFICRSHQGHLAELIRSRGHHCQLLDVVAEPEQGTAGVSSPAHASWLGCSWMLDAAQTRVILAELRPAWLVVDHYALDANWESKLRTHVSRIMVIDDLADRPHDCDLLLDQNLGRQPDDYREHVPYSCQILTGPRYALLRPEFARLRAFSLHRRKSSRLHQLLITMGGVDLPNATGEILNMLQQCLLPDDCRISVVMGPSAPWLGKVRDMARTMKWPTEILVGVNDMATHMANCDLAIGAAGSTSWERCCLGVPTLMVTLAQNQLVIGDALHHQGGAILIGALTAPHFKANFHELMSTIIAGPQCLRNMCANSSTLTDGNGCQDVIAWMI